MSGFRSALFGFNRDDVNSFIEQQTKNSAQKINDLKGQIDTLNQTNASLIYSIEQLKEEIEKYKAKEEQINEIANTIGTLYMVAKSNAEAMTQKAKQNKDATDAAVKNNLEIIESAQENFQRIKALINSAASSFADTIDNAEDSLNKTRESVEQNRKDIEQITKKVDAIL